MLSLSLVSCLGRQSCTANTAQALSGVTEPTQPEDPRSAQPLLAVDSGALHKEKGARGSMQLSVGPLPSDEKRKTGV